MLSKKISFEISNIQEYLEKNLICWTSGNEKVDNFVQEMQLKINNKDDKYEVVFQWVPYNQFSGIKETEKNDLKTVYSAIWRDGPLHKKYWDINNYTRNYARESNKKVVLNCLHNSQGSIDSLINETKKYPKHECLALYGISQNPDTGDYILVQNNYIWFSENEKIDNFIQERQLKINNFGDIVLEWIPYNQFNEIKEKGKNGLITVYLAIWIDSPIQQNSFIRDTRDSNKEVVLKCLHKQESIDSLINEAKKYPTKYETFQALYGISQNPDTGDYILVQNNSIIMADHISKNKKIDDFIQEMQLKMNAYNDIIFEWIPYNQLDEIKEIVKNSSITLYSAIWKNGPLHYDYSHKNFIRDSMNNKVALKCYNSVDFLINKAEKYLTKTNMLNMFNRGICGIHGISQNPKTNNFILVLAWTSGNEKIDDFIQDMQLKINNNYIVFEWIPYNQFNEIKETSKNGHITIYSAIWKNGPLDFNSGWGHYEYTRFSYRKVALKCLHKSQNSVDFLISEAKKYLINIFDRKICNIYGISQDPNTNNYILVLAWASGNEKIDDFIRELQLKLNEKNDDIVFEWIPYNLFDKIKLILKNNSITIYSAVWKDGPLNYNNNYYSKYSRYHTFEVALKLLHGSQGLIDSLINEVKKYSTSKFCKEFLKIYGISQDPDTNDYILVQENFTWVSGNKKIDDFVQEMQLKINTDEDVVFEWIPYDKFDYIKEASKNNLTTVYSAVWYDGPLKLKYHEYYHRNYYRDAYRQVVALKCLHNSENSIDFLINEV
ncbi:hypothetical protein RirG_144700 [Rhizophagus irregularis DAOM 197198w]|uniref:Protein kinase domain-containing protein n=1 Tax=Rhizophagus irregularis (strain DAOM 197198w) TaxID=1432141 RepID=A0A015K9W4_RHIIW|nr:hypothetical protein RirG_144700 [Rhizophagus irregularis DAOM 197198w]